MEGKTKYLRARCRLAVLGFWMATPPFNYLTPPFRYLVES